MKLLPASTGSLLGVQALTWADTVYQLAHSLFGIYSRSHLISGISVVVSTLTAELHGDRVHIYHDVFVPHSERRWSKGPGYTCAFRRLLHEQQGCFRAPTWRSNIVGQVYKTRRSRGTDWMGLSAVWSSRASSRNVGAPYRGSIHFISVDSLR